MQQSPEHRDVLGQFYSAYADNDYGAMERLLADDAGILFIGTDPNEWFTDRKDILTMIRAQLQANIGIDPGELQAYRDGSMVWTSNQGAFLLDDGARVPFRLTTVMRNGGDGWKIVQVHTSFPVSNEEAVGTDLTGA